MGSHNIKYKLTKEKYPTEEKVRKWYDRAVQGALSSDGHDPYNGTISTTRGIQFHYPAFEEEHISERDAFEHLFDNAEKWGPVLAVQFVTKEGKWFWLIAGWAAS